MLNAVILTLVAYKKRVVVVKLHFMMESEIYFYFYTVTYCSPSLRFFILKGTQSLP